MIHLGRRQAFPWGGQHSPPGKPLTDLDLIKQNIKHNGPTQFLKIKFQNSSPCLYECSVVLNQPLTHLLRKYNFYPATQYIFVLYGPVSIGSSVSEKPQCSIKNAEHHAFSVAW